MIYGEFMWKKSEKESHERNQGNILKLTQIYQAIAIGHFQVPNSPESIPKFLPNDRVFGFCALQETSLLLCYLCHPCK